ncbi:MAG: OmpH family outer membrane protein [Isosphaeraceae bacterium]
MTLSSRAFSTLGIGALAASLFVGNALGQAPGGDAAVRKTGTQAATAQPPAAAVPKPVAAVFGSVDMESIFKNADKVKALQEEFKAAAMAKQAELVKIQSELQEEAQKLQKMTPNSVDSKKIEDRITQLKAQFEAGREQAQRDFAMRESEMLATLYREIQDMVRRIAEFRGMTYVVQISNEPLSGSNPNSVMAAMAKTVVYADPRNDITKDVIYNLNRAYKAAGGTVPASATGTSAAPKASQATPAGN